MNKSEFKKLYSKIRGLNRKGEGVAGGQEISCGVMDQAFEWAEMIIENIYDDCPVLKEIFEMKEAINRLEFKAQYAWAVDSHYKNVRRDLKRRQRQ